MTDEKGQDGPTETMRRDSEPTSPVRDDRPPVGRGRLADDKSVPARAARASATSAHAGEKAGSAKGRAHLLTPARLPNSIRRIEQRLTVVPSGRDQNWPGSQSEQKPLLPPLPGAATHRAYGAHIWFTICVIVPTIAASLYYWLVASNQYVAEFRFSVSNNSVLPIPSSSGLLTLLGGVAAANYGDDYLVTDYITSPQAVQELQDRIQLKSLYSKPTIDWWSRFDASEPMENFVKYWQGMVTARFDAITGLATAEVRAFSPEDAQLIANTLVSLSEQLINQIASRSAIDAVRAATQQVEQAQERLKALHTRLTEYRNKFGIIDPTTSIAASNSGLIQTLRGSLAQLETQLEILKSQRLLPNAPAIVTLNNQIKSTREQLASTEAAVSRGRTGSGLSETVGEYEQLALEMQYAQNLVTNTMKALELARANAAQQQLYITPYVRPSLSQSARYPSRVFSTMTVGLLAFSFWIFSLTVVRALRERFA